MPAALVWAERETDVGPDDEPVPPDQSGITPDGRAARMVTDVSSPPVRWPRRATTVTSVLGARCWIVTPDGVLPAYRALSEPHPSEVGSIDFSAGLEGLDQPVVTTMVILCHEADYYRWADNGRAADVDVYKVEASLVWLE